MEITPDKKISMEEFQKAWNLVSEEFKIEHPDILKEGSASQNLYTYAMLFTELLRRELFGLRKKPS